MPTSMPTTRPSRSTFGQWTLGERVAILDMTCWETSHTLQCAHGHGGQGRLCGGGPNCRTWSILRWFPKPGGPPPVRGRAEQALWGLEDLEPRVREDTDNDSVLMLRQMYLPKAPDGPNGVQQEPERSEVLIDLGHTGLYSMGERTPPLPHQV